MQATFTKLKSGDWGIRTQGFVPAKGDSVDVKKKSGATQRVIVTKVVWHDDDVAICAIKHVGRERKPAKKRVIVPASEIEPEAIALLEKAGVPRDDISQDDLDWAMRQLHPETAQPTKKPRGRKASDKQRSYLRRLAKRALLDEPYNDEYHGALAAADDPSLTSSEASRLIEELR